jgi:putative radical SAM enzyme (TIGR03279 family)
MKDEDFRLSFLYGNFTTMNDISDEELEKIIRQKNSPQWVSVHTVDPEMREYIFGRPMKRDIIDTLSALAGEGIAVHTQAVIVPGKNDGGYLRDTIETLEAVHENIRTLAVVPVGLTGHREGLPRLRKFEPREMEEILDLVEPYRGRYLTGGRGSRFVFPSDEWYLGAGREVPGHDSYEGYPQIDNGVGMVRQLVTELDEDLEDPKRLDSLDRITIVTGELGEIVFRDYVFPLLKTRGIKTLPELVVVPNNFFGTSVTVSGLLVAKDIINAVKENANRAGIKEKVTLIPENCLNYEGVTIDGMDVDAMGDVLGGKVAVAGGSLVQSLIAAAGGEG